MLSTPTPFPSCRIVEVTAPQHGAELDVSHVRRIIGGPAAMVRPAHRLPDNIRWLRFDGQRWQPVNPTLADRLGVTRTVRVLKRAMLRLRKGQHPFRIDYQQDLAALARDCQAQHRPARGVERSHQHIGHNRNSFGIAKDIGPGLYQPCASTGGSALEGGERG